VEIAEVNGMSRNGTQRIWDYRQGVRVDTKYGKPETPDQYAAFMQYLQMVKPRSITGLAKILNRNSETLRRWQQKFKWDIRAAAWDKNQVAISHRESTAAQRKKHREAIQEYREAAEEQARTMMGVTNDLTSILAQRVKVAEDTGEEIPMTLVAGLLKATASISEAGRQAWAAALGVDELMEVVEVELQNAQRNNSTVSDDVLVLEASETDEDVFEFELDE
jgi:hypothetical protein